MKKTFSIAIMMFSLLLIWCTYNQHLSSNNPNLDAINSWSISSRKPTLNSTGAITKKETILTNGELCSQYVNWYTWECVIITNFNTGSIISRTWDQFLYVNQVFWFQVLLWKEWKGGKIEQNDGMNFTGNTIMFFMPWNHESYPDWFLPIVNLNILTYNVYNFINTTPQGPDWGTWELPSVTYGENNNYYFMIVKDYFDPYMQKLFPSLKCERIPYGENDPYLSCPWWLDKVFLSWFKTFNIK